MKVRFLAKTEAPRERHWQGPRRSQNRVRALELFALKSMALQSEIRSREIMVQGNAMWQSVLPSGVGGNNPTRPTCRWLACVSRSMWRAVCTSDPGMRSWICPQDPQAHKGKRWALGDAKRSRPAFFPTRNIRARPCGWRVILN